MEGYRAGSTLVPVSGDFIKVVMLHTIAYRFRDAPHDTAWVALAEQASGWQLD